MRPEQHHLFARQGWTSLDPDTARALVQLGLIEMRDTVLHEELTGNLKVVSYEPTNREERRENSADSSEARLAEYSRWIDSSAFYRDLEPTLHRLLRITKVTEERGEAIQALYGVFGENPRKGVTHTDSDVIGELLDIAVSALGAVEYMTGNRGRSLGLLHDKIKGVHRRMRTVGI